MSDQIPDKVEDLFKVVVQTRAIEAENHSLASLTDYLERNQIE